MPEDKGAPMKKTTGPRYVLVIKRDRMGKWWKRKGGADVRGQIWEPMSKKDAAEFEGTAGNTGYLRKLENNR